MANTQTHAGMTFPVAGPGVLRSLANNWWLLLLRGVAAILFGILAFFWPGITLLTLTLFWGAYAFSDGVFALWGAISAKGAETASRWWLALVGVISVVAGVLTFLWPDMTAAVLLIFIATWAIVIGILQIWGAIQLRKEIEGEWLLALNGFLSIAFGAIMLVQPAAGALAVVWLIGWFAILAGCSYIALAFKLKKYKRPA